MGGARLMLQLEGTVADPQNDIVLVFTNTSDATDTKEIALKGMFYF